MRTALLLFAFAFSTAAGAHSISDEFAAGFGGVSWGMSFKELVKQFPGGYQSFCTAPGGVCYTLNMEDPVLGVTREGDYARFGTDADGKVMECEIQIPFERADSLIQIISGRFGPVIGPENDRLVKAYHWPTDGGMYLAVRTSIAGGVGLATLSIAKLARKSPSPSKGGDRRSRPATSAGAH